jgi:hypothetical protein
MLKYCGDELDPKSRTLRLPPVEIARQMALAARADFCARATERGDVARRDEGHGRRARARLLEHQAHHQTSSTHQPLAGWHRKYCASPTTRRCASAMLKRFIELAHCYRDVHNLHGHVRRRPQPVGRAAAQGPLGEAADQVGEALRPNSTSSAIARRTRPRYARCCAASSTSGRGRRLTMRACST